jgi:hypothetical protein
MEQLKVIWANVVKYHFWILTPLVLIASLGAFYASRSALDEKVKSRISKLDSDFRTVSTLNMDAPKHPNSSTEKEMDAILGSVTNNVKNAWTKQYERQKLILTWSSNVIQNPDILKQLDGYRPIEQFLDYPLKEEPIKVTWRDQYKFYIKNVFPDLAKIIGAKWTAPIGNAAAPSDSGDAGSDGGSTNTSTPSGPTPLVNWSGSSQSTLQASIVPWFNLPQPSTLDICYTQEDIWILEGILRVIKATNGKAKENFQAPIKEVEWIKIGKSAGTDAATIMPLGGGDGADYSGGDGFAPAVAAVSPDPADNRYVDSNYKPVPAAKLRAAMKSSNPEDAFFVVAKRVPVRFRLKMDQSKIPKLLAECGNGDLMIEVKQARINTSDGASGISIGSGMMGMAAGAIGMDDSGDGGTGDMGGDDSGGSGMSAATQATQADPPVEVYGIVYLFNPVDLNKLGLDKVTENTTLVTTTTTPTPATAIPAAAPAPVVDTPATPAAPATPTPVAPPATGAPGAPVAPSGTPAGPES